jgi:hypothetical protein
LVGAGNSGSINSSRFYWLETLAEISRRLLGGQT